MSLLHNQGDKDRQKTAQDTGLALVLLLLLLDWFTGAKWLLPTAISLLVFSLLCPVVFRPLAGPWLALATTLGTISSAIILTGLFFLIVTPIGLLRRLCGADPMQLRQWRQGGGSVLRKREHLFEAKDLEKPY